MVTNEPINRAEGKTEQADLEAANASEIRQALAILKAAEDNKVIPSRYQIGDRVKVLGSYEASVEAIRFTTGKVRYDVFLDVVNTKLDNVDSFYVTDIEVPA